ncbi:glucose-6-phosphate dehydrogenase [Nocardioidaceae bacterium SCSIO 66511]|nr:glucose-6-phosphate dehydrogenase [Nocardioidaceae bacterium SCSIO 66511]
MASAPTTQSLVILGATGDLTARLLLPGLGGMLATGDVQGLEVIGSGLDDWDDERWRSRVRQSFADSGASGAELDRVVAKTRYVQADATDAADLAQLLDRCHGEVVVYFALPPSVTVKVCHAMATIDLDKSTRLVLEKPFGQDVDSAEALNELVTGLVPEDHVHRVDHFLAMATVLNILGLRFANRVVEPLLNNTHVASVDIIFDESLALEGRAGYYDSTGAMIDMIQSHLLQVLALFAMEPPATLESRDVRDAKGQVLRATRVWDDDPVRYSRRARYTAGDIDGHRVPAYVDEEGVNGSRRTETFAELVLAVDTWRWTGVPFRVRSGKALGSPRTEITVTFRPPQHIPTHLSGPVPPDRFHIGITLDKNRFGLDFNISGEGDPFGVDPVSMRGEFGSGALPPYGDVLMGVFKRDPVLSVRGDAAVQCWRIIEPVRAAWAQNEVPLTEYAAGSPGPDGWSSTGLP